MEPPPRIETSLEEHKAAIERTINNLETAFTSKAKPETVERAANAVIAAAGLLIAGAKLRVEHASFRKQTGG